MVKSTYWVSFSVVCLLIFFVVSVWNTPKQHPSAYLAESDLNFINTFCPSGKIIADDYACDDKKCSLGIGSADTVVVDKSRVLKLCKKHRKGNLATVLEL